MKQVLDAIADLLAEFRGRDCGSHWERMVRINQHPLVVGANDVAVGDQGKVVVRGNVKAAVV